MKILRHNEFPHRQMSSTRTGESYGLSADLSVSKDLFVRHEILPPGARASAPHAHDRTDELVFVLEGQASIHEGQSTARAYAGDCVCFEAGSQELHYVANESPEEVVLLVVSRRIEGPDARFE